MWAAIFIIIALFTLLFGLFVYQYPTTVIEIQKRFYLLINWRMEPVSLSKEVRNTRWMGLFLIIFALLSCFYYWIQ